MSVSVDLPSAVSGNLIGSGAPEAAGGLSLASLLANELAGGSSAGTPGVVGGDFAALLGLLGASQGDVPAGTETDTSADASDSDASTPEDQSASAVAAALAFSLQPAAAVVSEAVPTSGGGAVASPVDAAPVTEKPVACAPAKTAAPARPEGLLETALAGVTEPKDEVADDDAASAEPTTDASASAEPTADASASAGKTPAAATTAAVADDATVTRVRPVAAKPQTPATGAPAEKTNPTPTPDAVAKVESTTGVVEQVHVATSAGPTRSAPHASESKGAVEDGAASKPPTERPVAPAPPQAVQATAGVQPDEEREPGRRGSDGGVVKAQVPTLARQTVDEAPTARRTNGGPDPSAPGPLPSLPNRESAPAPAPAAAPEPLRDVERFLRLQELRPGPIADRGEMRLHVSSDLGAIEVRVAVRDDVVHANLYAQHDQARQTLEAQRSTLASALERSNLRLEGFTVGLGQHQQGGEGEQGRDGGLPSWSTMTTGPAASVDDVVYEPAAPLRGLSLRA